MIWTVKKIVYRSMHKAGRPFMPYARIPQPRLLTGPGSVKELPAVIKAKGFRKVLIVTDKIIHDIGLMDGLMDAMTRQEIQYEVFDGVQPNPTIQNVEAGLKKYQDSGCEALIAFGGGSSMDCCKTVGARAMDPDKSVKEMGGLFKIKKAIPFMAAVPTTAGTGSEVTWGAVISDPENHAKFPIASFKVIPKYAVLDPELTLGLPPDITATTGIDALTHAVEAYISLWATPYTDDKAEKAVKIIFEDLESLYQDGADIKKRNNMALASYYAGRSICIALVGYVHAIAHNLGGFYHVPHGLANAIVLPYILEYSRDDIRQRLARLAWISGIGSPADSDDVLCDRFIEKIKSMNQNMGIPRTIEALREKDIPHIARGALKEANPEYPVPTLMNQKDCEDLIRKLMP